MIPLLVITGRLTRRVYYQWARLVTQYPIRVTSASVFIALLAALSFAIKTPFTVGNYDLANGNPKTNNPKNYILQFSLGRL
jgi:hypothetical protein